MNWDALRKWPLLLASLLAFGVAVYIFQGTEEDDGQTAAFALVILGSCLLGGFLVVEGHDLHDRRKDDDDDVA